MQTYWVASAIALMWMTVVAAAQTNAPQPTWSTNGPAGSVEKSQTGVAVDNNGAVAVTRDTFAKTQSYTNDDGRLTAKTTIRSTGPLPATAK